MKNWLNKNNPEGRIFEDETVYLVKNINLTDEEVVEVEKTLKTALFVEEEISIMDDADILGIIKNYTKNSVDARILGINENIFEYDFFADDIVIFSIEDILEVRRVQDFLIERGNSITEEN